MSKQLASRFTQPHSLSNVRSDTQTFLQIPFEKLVFPENPVQVPSERQLAKLTRSMENEGFIGAIVVNQRKEVIIGSIRAKAAHLAGFISIPSLMVTHLSPAQEKAHRIFDNRIARDSKIDPKVLWKEFNAILELDDTYDLTRTAYEAAEIDLILCGEYADGSDPADDFEAPDDEAAAVTQRGDVWLVKSGRRQAYHILYCGDCMLPESYERAMPGESAAVVITDSPYGVSSKKIGSRGRVKHRDFENGGGQESDAEFENFLFAATEAMTNRLRPGGLYYGWMDWKKLHVLSGAIARLGFELKNICIWDKQNAGMGSLYRSQHELCIVAKKPGGSHTNNIQLGKYGRYRTNVWSYPGLSGFGKTRLKDLADHPTVKPTRLFEDIILDVTERGDIVLDGFSGSGTTLIASEKTGRVARCIEIDGRYCDVAVRRFKERFGIEAVLQSNGLTFTEVAKLRLASNGSLPDQAATAAPLPRRRPPPPPAAANGRV